MPLVAGYFGQGKAGIARVGVVSTMTDKTAAADDVEIEIEDDKSKLDAAEIVVEPGADLSAQLAPIAPAPVITVDEGIDALKRSLESEKSRRMDAERRAQEAAALAQARAGEVDDANLTLVTNAIDGIKRDMFILKANLRNALATQDYDAVADAQEAMSANSAKLLQLESGKAAMESRQKQPAPVSNADPVEELAARLTPKSADWVRNHPEFATDARLYQKMIAAHQLAVADGEKPDTDGYFRAVEDVLKINKPIPVADDVVSEAAAVVRHRQSPPSAPVSRVAATNSKPNVVRLTADEREMASMMGMTDQEYARNKVLLSKEGKIGTGR
jgi:hypothetical protein